VFVVYAVLAQVAVHDMRLAGILPGLPRTLLCIRTVAAIGWRRAFPQGERLSRADRLRARREGAPMLLIAVVIIGTILGGYGSPTEAAAIGAVVATAIGLFHTRTLKPADFPQILLRTGLNAALVLFLVAAAGVVSPVLIFGQVPQTAAASIQEVATTPAAFVRLVRVALLIVGTVIDGIPRLIMAVPILLPIATAVHGIHPLPVGVVVSINHILGLLSPPVGIGLYVAAAVSRANAVQVSPVTLPFFPQACVARVILALLPWLSLALL
jgi:tripartite ATP-independent transporter DctM subunit